MDRALDARAAIAVVLDDLRRSDGSDDRMAVLLDKGSADEP